MPILFVAVLVIMGSFAMLLPSIIYVLSNMGLSSGLSTPILAVYSFAQFIAGPRWGRLSDKIGRKKTLAITLIGSAVSYGVMAGFADSIGFLFGAMMFAGVFAGGLAVVFASVSDITSNHNRTQGMGVIGAGIGLAFIIGTAIGGSISGSSAETASLVGPAGGASIASALGFVLLLLFMKETLPTDVLETSTKGNRGDHEAPFQQLRGNLPLVKLSALIFGFTFCLALMEPLIPKYIEFYFDWGPKEMRNIFLYVGVILVVVQGGLVGRLARRWGERVVARNGLVLMGTGLLGLALFPQANYMLLSLALTSVGAAFFNAATMSLASQLAGDNQKGTTMGVAQSMQSLGRSFGPLIAGVLFDVRSDVPFWVASIIVFILLGVFLGNMRRLA